MNIQEEIRKAIGAHGMWKQNLRSAIDSGKSEHSTATVCQDNQCAFGKWLYSVDATIKSSSRWQCVKTAHAEFHREAARVLDLALAGKKKEADDGLAFTSNFGNASAKLTKEMMEWMKEAA